MKVSVIATVKNEEGSIRELIQSLLSQTRRPDEIVLVDGGSTDHTREIVQEFVDDGAPLTLLVQPGANISEGRNLAIACASGDIIASTDAGVRLAPAWLEELIKPFRDLPTDATAAPALEDRGPDVVSGFFIADGRTLFEMAMGATVLPSLAEINPDRFLPSSRSVAYRKSAWAAVGGYPEWLDYCEDLVFDLELKRRGFRFAFAPAGVVYFRPRSSLAAFFRQYYRYARGDGKALLWTKRHIVRYTAYVLGCIALLGGFWYKILWLALMLAAAAYLYQPYCRLVPLLRRRRLADWLIAVGLVPLIRLVGDVAKMLGYPVGLFWRYRRRGDYARPIHRHR